MLRIDSYAIHPETDRFHSIRRIAAQPFVACMALPLSFRLSRLLTNEAKSPGKEVASRKNEDHPCRREHEQQRMEEPGDRCDRVIERTHAAVGVLCSHADEAGSPLGVLSASLAV